MASFDMQAWAILISLNINVLRLSKIFLHVVKMCSFTLNNNSLCFIIYINIMFHASNII